MYKPVKSLGQNFLVGSSVAHKMVDALELAAGDQLIEIGAGLGALTEIISDKTRDIKVETIALEIDERFVEKLTEMFSKNHNLSILKEDVLTWLPNFYAQLGFKIIGSLPYYLTSPIIHLAVKHAGMPSKCVFLIQKEVAHKIKDLAPDGSYLSNFINAFFNVKIIASVPRGNFKPVPKVDSCVILLTRKTDPVVSFATAEKFQGFLHKGFSNPRKMLNKIFTQEELESVDINPSLRAQHLTLEQWARLFNKLVV